MAIVAARGQKLGNRLAIASIVVLTLIFLSPIYWITSTAFKPRAMATTAPPTITFQPEISPFIKLMTKPVQLDTPVDQATYDAAPWWERLIYDGGQTLTRDADGNIQLSGYPNRFLNSLIVAITSTFLAVAMGTVTAYGFSRFKVKGEADLLFFI